MHISKQPHDPQPETYSEKLFASYLDTSGYSDWLFEPQIDGRTKHPDFLVPTNGKHLVFDVKQRDYQYIAPGAAMFSPERGFKELINRGAKKFKGFKDMPCSLVIYNDGDLDTPMRTLLVFEAMLGDLGYVWDMDTRTFNAIPGSERVEFQPKHGEMIASYKRGEPRNTTINAIIVLEERGLRNCGFEQRIEAETTLKTNRFTRRFGRIMTDDERARIEIGVLLKTPHENGRVVRVIVCENPWARIPLPRDIFCELYDERWAMVDRKLVRVWQGSKVADLNDAYFLSGSAR